MPIFENESVDIQKLLDSLKSETDALENKIANLKAQHTVFRLKLRDQKNQIIKEQEAIRQILLLAQQESIAVQLEKNDATREREHIALSNPEALSLAIEKERLIKQKEEAIWQNMQQLGERMGKLADKILTIDDKMKEIDEKIANALNPIQENLDKKKFDIEMKQQKIDRLKKK